MAPTFRLAMVSDANSIEDQSALSPWHLRHCDVCCRLPQSTHAVAQHVSLPVKPHIRFLRIGRPGGGEGSAIDGAATTLIATPHRIDVGASLKPRIRIWVRNGLGAGLPDSGVLPLGDGRRNVFMHNGIAVQQRCAGTACSVFAAEVYRSARTSPAGSRPASCAARRGLRSEFH
jgi:hypothetical protein